MACSINVQNRPVVRSLEAVDLPPPPLADLHILDLLELTGSQFKAAEVLTMHQSTVSRSLRMMSQQFHLQRQRGTTACRYGNNESLHLLRLSYRAHRLMDGLLRIATDALHQPLLHGLGRLQPDWLQSQDLELLAAQPPLLEQLWLLLPPGSVHQSREAQDLIGTLRQRVGRASESPPAGRLDRIVAATPQCVGGPVG